MTRHGYVCSDDIEDNLAYGRFRGAVSSAIKGKRGQKLLRELLDVLERMPKKELYANNFATPEGEYCALGAYAKDKGLTVDNLGDDIYCDTELVADRFGVSDTLVREIMYVNDFETDTEEYLEYEICGPVRPHWPDWGKRKTLHVVPRDPVEVARERYDCVLQWVKRNLKTEPKTEEKESENAQ